MNWNGKDAELYGKEKEFIDTAVVQLLPLDLGAGMKSAAEKGEFIQLLSMHLERQFRGRMMFLPPFTYFEDLSPDMKQSLLSSWEVKLKEAGFKYVFYLTSDLSWKNEAKPKAGSLLAVPPIPLSHMEEQYKHSLMEDQVMQLLNTVVQLWQREEE